MGKGSNTTSSTSSPNPQASAAYSSLLNRAAGVANTPYQGYSGELTAPVNAQQTTGIGNINANAGFASPYIQQAGGLASSAANPLTSNQINQYLSPYTQDVVNATQAQFANQNAQQQAALTGNSIAQGALGGNRVGVAQANLAGQQALSQAPVIAGLYNTGYQNALQTAQQQFQANPLQAAYALQGIGVGGQNAALSGAQAQVGAGTLQQQTQQAGDTAAYQQFLQQQAYPFQTTQWLAGIDTGVGSQLGGTSSTTGPPPNQTAQYLGLGLAGAGLFLRDGGAVRRAGFADGGAPGMPYAGAPSWIPTISIHGGSGAPHAPGLAAAPQQVDPTKMATGITGLADKLSGKLSGPAWGGGSFWSGDAYGGSSANPAEGLTAADYGEGFARGGAPILLRPGFADGGSPMDETSFLAISRGDPAWANPDIGPGYAMPVPKAGFDERFGNLPPARTNRPFVDTYQGTAGFDPRAFKDEVPLPAARPAEAPEAPDDEETEPVAVAGRRGVPVMASDADAAPVAASAPGAGFAPSAAVPESTGPGGTGLGALLGLPSLSPAARAGLLSAGFGMLASRSPFLGTAIGEGGQAGLGTYSNVVQGEQKEAETKRRIDLEAQRLAQDADRATKDLALRTRALDEKGDLTEYQRAELKLKAQEDAIRLRTPIKVGETVSGTPIMALPQLGPDGKVGLYPIGRDGSVSTTPIGPGSSIKPSSAAMIPPAGTPAPPGSADPNAPAGTTASRNQSYLTQVAQEDPGYADAIKKAANYELDPAKYASMRAGQRQKFINDVIQFDPNYNPQDVGLRYRAQAAFLPGTKSGDTVTAFNTAISHLDTLKQMYQALHNGDVQALNRLKNTFQQQFGYPAPNDVAALASIIGGEVVKATVGSQNALGDREEVRQSIGRDLSTMQADSVIDKYQSLMAGQLNARKFAYEQGTGLHNFEERFLLPRSREVLHSVAGEGSRINAPQAEVPAGAIEMLRRNPALAPQFEQKYGAGSASRYLGQ